MADSISNRDDLIDSRDVIARVEELEDNEERDEDEEEELTALRALAEEAAGCGDWEHGETLIRDSYFEDYARELADDLGLIKDAGWPYTCIDWGKAATDLQIDYTSVEFDGVTYWLRS